MLCKKPADVTYTQMAIWIDKFGYTEDVDVDTMYKYMYLLSYMLASKERYFKVIQDYDDFSIFCASVCFMRYRNPKQFVDGSIPKMPRIKSVLNYLKRIIYPLKVQYEQMNYKQFDPLNTYIKNVLPSSSVSEESDILNSVRNLARFDEVDFNIYLTQLSKTIQQIVNKLPRKRFSSESHNIYISCLLTIINSITLTKKDSELIKSYLRSDKSKSEYKQALFDGFNIKDVVIYHLDKSMVSYIWVVTNSIRIQLKDELSDILNSTIKLDDIIYDAYSKLNNIEEGAEEWD